MKLPWDDLLQGVLGMAHGCEAGGRTDPEDVAVIAVLQSLHAAARGEHDLTKLALACIDLHEGGR